MESDLRIHEVILPAIDNKEACKLLMFLELPDGGYLGKGAKDVPDYSNHLMFLEKYREYLLTDLLGFVAYEHDAWYYPAIKLTLGYLKHRGASGEEIDNLEKYLKKNEQHWKLHKPIWAGDAPDGVYLDRTFSPRWKKVLEECSGEKGASYASFTIDQHGKVSEFIHNRQIVGSLSDENFTVTVQDIDCKEISCEDLCNMMGGDGKNTAVVEYTCDGGGSIIKKEKLQEWIDFLANPDMIDMVIFDIKTHIECIDACYGK
jgi:hypothetical protein